MNPPTLELLLFACKTSTIEQISSKRFTVVRTVYQFEWRPKITLNNLVEYFNSNFTPDEHLKLT